MSFAPNPEVKRKGVRVAKDEKPVGGPVHQRDLHPCKPVVTAVEETFSSGESRAQVPPQTGRCTHEDLKPSILDQLGKLSTELKQQLSQIERKICRRLGLPDPTIKTTCKRKANDDTHRNSGFQKSGGPQTQPPTSRAKKKQSPHVVALARITSRVYFGREKTTASLKWWCTFFIQGTRTPDDGGLQVEETGTPVILKTLSNVLFAFPKTYVSRPKSPINNRCQTEKPISVECEETNPNASDPKVPSTRIEDVGEPGPAKKLKVSKPALVEHKHFGVPSPVGEEEKYDSCKEDICNDSQLQEEVTQEKRGHQISDTDENSNDA
ncbi:unnamed protein product [Eruca vesicaria subsp. sativa]|uniref:Uncharacterized protein n=1 Tax=Eruca vesicaria subsp. sativa TaxID=29727 RepID=A0ABC8JNL7_ERUVS|nr:unnamed protein product [Eruca vesicaria subsp. sativa]